MLGVAGGELLLELLLRALRRRGLAKQPLRVDEADLVVGGGRRAGVEPDQRDGAHEGRGNVTDAALQSFLLRSGPQNTDPTWNWNFWMRSWGLVFSGNA